MKATINIEAHITSDISVPFGGRVYRALVVELSTGRAVGVNFTGRAVTLIPNVLGNEASFYPELGEALEEVTDLELIIALKVAQAKARE